MITTTQPPTAGHRNLHLVQSLQQHTVFTSCAFVYLKSTPHLVIIPINKNTKLLYLDPEFKLSWKDEISSSLLRKLDNAEITDRRVKSDNVKLSVQYVWWLFFFLKKTGREQAVRPSIIPPTCKCATSTRGLSTSKAPAGHSLPNGPRNEVVWVKCRQTGGRKWVIHQA